MKAGQWILLLFQANQDVHNVVVSFLNVWWKVIQLLVVTSCAKIFRCASDLEKEEKRGLVFFLLDCLVGISNVVNTSMFENEVFCFRLPCVFGNLLSKGHKISYKKRRKDHKTWEFALSFSILLDVWSEVVSTSPSRKGKRECARIWLLGLPSIFGRCD